MVVIVKINLIYFNSGPSYTLRILIPGSNTAAHWLKPISNAYPHLYLSILSCFLPISFHHSYILHIFTHTPLINLFINY